jgi:hypothetical protein
MPSLSASAVVYEIDERDHLVSVNDEWTAFAVANDAPELAAPGILGVKLWDAVTDRTMAELYRGLLERVRAGVQLQYQFRCDGPAVTRDMIMHVGALPGGRVRFTSRVEAATERRAQPILDRRTLRSDELIHVCGWCQRIAVTADRWVDVEIAIQRIPMHAAGLMPQLTHGICPTCYDAVVADLRPSAH